MPLTPVSMAGTIVPALAAASFVGVSAPQFGLSIANGAVLYAQAAVVNTVDTGTVGAGASSIPLVVQPGLLLPNLLSGFAAQAITGTMAPALAGALASGMALGFATGLVTTTHPSVGNGAGVARIVASSAVPFMLAGFASGGMTGLMAVRQATAIGIALDLTFASFVMAIPIVGASGPYASAGAGFGKIV